MDDSTRRWLAQDEWYLRQLLQRDLLQRLQSTMSAEPPPRSNAMSALKKPHPEDDMLAEQIARATRYSACLHLGPGNRHTRYIEQGGREGYEAALAVAAELNDMSKFGRRAVVYAINSLGSFPVDTKLAKLAGLVDA